MPTPSSWAIGVASPSYVDPYQALEASTAVPGSKGGGGLRFGQAAGEGLAPKAGPTGGHWKEVLDPSTPAPWILAAVLIAVGVLHLGIKGNVKAGGEL